MYIRAGVLKGQHRLARERFIKDILARGHVAKFTHAFNGIVKKVNKWNIDEDGDLIAFEHTGRVPYVCWDGPEYNIEEE